MADLNFKEGTILEILERHLENIRTEMTKQMDAYGRNASGRSVKGLTIQMFDWGGRLSGNTGSWYAMEQGRAGGRVPYGFQSIIRQWIIDKGISVTPKPYIRPERGIGLSPEERGLRSMAGAIAYRIMKDGTRLYRDHQTNDIYSSVLQKELAEFKKEVHVWIHDQIHHIHLIGGNKI